MSTKTQNEQAAQALINIRALCSAIPDSARFGEHRNRFAAQVESGLKALGWIPTKDAADDGMTVSEAVRRLEDCFSEDDPIRYKRQDTTPNRLRDICDLGLAKDVRIVFYDSMERQERRGTLLDMVRSREAAKARGEFLA